MGGLVDPELFGCASKLPFDETISLSKQIGRPGVSDYSIVDAGEAIAISVDRVYQCSDDFDTFAAIALNHVINDTNVSFAVPTQASIAFEYSSELSPALRLQLAQSFKRGLSSRNVDLGKCHSSLADSKTSVTVTVAARGPQKSSQELDEGIIYLGRRLGSFKLHYLSEMGLLTGLSEHTELLTNPFPSLDANCGMARITDVSGHGLAGSLYNLCQKYDLDLDVTLDPSLAADLAVLDHPLPCFQNALQHFVLPDVEIDEEAWRLAGLMETAGPLVGLANAGTSLSDDPFCTGTLISLGSFRRGSGRLHIRWKD